MRQQSPAHHFRNALAVLGADRNEHERSGRFIPISLEVRRRSVEVELQLDLDFGIVAGKSNASAHAQSCKRLDGKTASLFAEYPLPMLLAYLAGDACRRQLHDLSERRVGPACPA
jgi:hypothetical protein